RERLVIDHMLEEELPLYFKGIVIIFLLRNFGPAVKEVDRLRNVGIPYWLRRIAVVLNIAFSQACHGGAFGAIYLQGQQVIPSYPYRPGRVEMRNNIPFQFEGGVRRIVSGAFISFTLFIYPFFDVGST